MSRNRLIHTQPKHWDAVSIKIGLPLDLRCEHSDVVLAVMQLVFACANNFVNYYANENDGMIWLDDDAAMARMTGLSLHRWKKAKAATLSYFEIVGEKLRPRHAWINEPERRNTAASARPSLPPALRVQVGERDNWTCGYCGSKSGPFDVDHVVPISLGGALTDLRNLLLACAPCNRSKGAKMVSEWIA